MHWLVHQRGGNSKREEANFSVGLRSHMTAFLAFGSVEAKGSSKSIDSMSHRMLALEHWWERNGYSQDCAHPRQGS